MCWKVNLTGSKRFLTGCLPALTTRTNWPMTEPDMRLGWAARLLTLPRCGSSWSKRERESECLIEDTETENMGIICNGCKCKELCDVIVLFPWPKCHGTIQRLFSSGFQLAVESQDTHQFCNPVLGRNPPVEKHSLHSQTQCLYTIV